jgi:DNA-binding MarR family transcriptional regulator
MALTNYTPAGHFHVPEGNLMRKRTVERIAAGLGSFMRVLHIMRNRSEAEGVKPPPLDPQYVMLAFLREGPLPMSELSRRLGCSKPNVTALADRLIGEGLARRVPDRKDGRRVLMEITERGKAAGDARRASARAAIRMNLSPLSEKELEELCGSLESINRIISRLGSD